MTCTKHNLFYPEPSVENRSAGSDFPTRAMTSRSGSAPTRLGVDRCSPLFVGFGEPLQRTDDTADVKQENLHLLIKTLI